MNGKTKEVTVNERGRRIGESHPRAKLTDHEIDLIRELAESGMSYRKIAEKFDLSSAPARDSRNALRTVGAVHVGKIVRCVLRGQTPARAKRVKAE